MPLHYVTPWTRTLGALPVANYATRPGGNELLGLNAAAGQTTPPTLAVSTEQKHDAGRAVNKLTKGSAYAFVALASVSGSTTPLLTALRGQTITYGAWVYLSAAVTNLRTTVRAGPSLTFSQTTRAVPATTWTWVTRTATIPADSNGLTLDVGWEASDAPAGTALYVAEHAVVIGTTLDPLALPLPYLPGYWRAGTGGIHVSSWDPTLTLHPHDWTHLGPDPLAPLDYRRMTLGNGPIYSEAGKPASVGSWVAGETGPTGLPIRRLQRDDTVPPGWGSYIGGWPDGPDIPAGKRLRITGHWRSRYPGYTVELHVVMNSSAGEVNPTTGRWRATLSPTWSAIDWTFTSVNPWRVPFQQRGSGLDTQQCRVGVGSPTGMPDNYVDLTDLCVEVLP